MHPQPSRLLRLALTLAIASIFIAPAAFAERFEITPFAGYRSSGDFERSIADFDFFNLGLEIEEGEAYGVIFGFNVTRHLLVELSYSTQDSVVIDQLLIGDQVLFDLDLDYLHAGVAYQFASSGRVRPFISGSLGVTRLLPRDGAFDDDERFSAALGGGVKLMLADHVGIRFEGRGYWTVLDDGDEVVCTHFDDCYRQELTDTLIQGELRAGLTFAF